MDKSYKRQDRAIVSERQATIQALKSYEVRSTLVWNCVKKLNRMDRQNKVSIRWIAGYVRIYGWVLEYSVDVERIFRKVCQMKGNIGKGKDSLKIKIREDLNHHSRNNLRLTRYTYFEWLLYRPQCVDSVMICMSQRNTSLAPVMHPRRTHPGAYQILCKELALLTPSIILNFVSRDVTL